MPPTVSASRDGSASDSADVEEMRDLAVDLLVTSARFTRLAARFADSNMPRPLWRLLGILEQHGPSRVSDLAAADKCSQPTMTGMVHRLADQGWVKRAPDASDGRAVVVSLTPSGRRALVTARHRVGDALAPRLAHLSDTDRAAIAAGLTAVRRLMEVSA